MSPLVWACFVDVPKKVHFPNTGSINFEPIYIQYPHATGGYFLIDKAQSDPELSPK